MSEVAVRFMNHGNYITLDASHNITNLFNCLLTFITICVEGVSSDNTLYLERKGTAVALGYVFRIKDVMVSQ